MRTQNKYISSQEIAMFCEQVALILKSGIPLSEGIETLCLNYENTRYGDKFEAIRKVTVDTGSLYEALAAVECFPPYMVNMVRIGEKAGKLDDVMNALADYYGREDRIYAAVKNAVLYPVILLIMLTVVITVLVVKVLPIFEQVYGNLGTEMSASASSVMYFGMGLGRSMLILMMVLAILAALVVVLRMTKYWKQVRRILLAIFPIYRQVSGKLSVSRFASAISMLLSSGYPLEDAVAMVADVITDDEAKEKVTALKASLEAGVSFPQALEQAGLFEKLYIRMIRVGYVSGQIDSVMGKIAGIYETEIDDSLQTLLSLIEPTLVAILSVMIGAILLVVLLPLAGILSSIA